MSMCRVFSCVVGRGCFLWPVHFLGKTLLVFALLHSTFQDQICLFFQVSLVHWFLECRRSLLPSPVWPLPICLDSWTYEILLFTASDLASVTSHIHNCVLFLLWLHPFILSGVISPLISSSILGTYLPGEFPFQYPVILPFHTVDGVLKARILK